MKPYVIELRTGRNILLRQRWWWVIRSTANGQTVAHSENYATYENARQTASRVAESAGWAVIL